MELILAIMIGIICLIKGTNECSVKRQNEERRKAYDIVAESTRIDYNAARVAKEVLSDPLSRVHCFEAIIDGDLKLILGEGWKERFDNPKSLWVFENALGEPGAFGYQFLHLENIVYYVFLAKAGRAPDHFVLHKIEGFSTEESYRIIKRVCAVIERSMKQAHPGFEKELDMFVCRVGNDDTVEFRYRVEYLQLSNTERLKV